MAWFFDRGSRKFRKANNTPNADLILARLERYLQDVDRPISMLCGFWDDQRDAISYQELRTLVEQGYLDEKMVDEWQQDYTHLVTERMPEVWGSAILAGSTSQPVMDAIASVFVFEPTRTTVLNWVRARAALLVTNCTQKQRDAIAVLLEDRTRRNYGVDELAKLIRPCIGLTKGQASAVRNFYDSLVASLTEQHPRTSPERIQARALDKAMKYAEQLHRQRAMTIAQTEMAYAYNFGAHEGVRQARESLLLGRCVKRWNTSGDDRVCKRCAALGGTEVGMEEAFFTANLVDFPEAGLLPPIHPRCACAVEYIEVEPPVAWLGEIQPGTVGRSGLYGPGWSVTTDTPKKPELSTYGCVDVTKDWLDHATPNSHTIRDVAVFNQDGVRYEVDGRDVKLDYSAREKTIAELLESRLGGELLMMPRVDNPGSVKTPDYIFRGMRYDLKSMSKSSSKNAVYNRINESLGQADNFILDITGNPLGRQELERQAEKIFYSRHTRSVRTIILVENNEIVRILRRT